MFRSLTPFLPAFIHRLQLNAPPPPRTAFRENFEKQYGANELPFLNKGYAHSLDEAKKHLKFLLVVLLSPEHSLTHSYATETLSNSHVVSYLNDKSNNILLWGGSVADSEAYQISTAFKVTKFPYAALIAPTPSSASSSSGMSIIATMVGPIPPTEFLAQIRHAIDVHSPELVSLRADRAEREFTRNIRAEQDSAYEQSLAKDRERARKKKEDAERVAFEIEQASRAEKDAQEKADKYQTWRLWRASQIKPEPDAKAKEVTRVSIRLSNGERLIRRFHASSSTIEELYAVVECRDLLQEEISKEANKPARYTHKYAFQLVSPLPRLVYHVNSQEAIGKTLGSSANLMVETLAEDDES